MQKIDIPTRDGACPSYLFRPAGRGPWPAVLVYMDGIGIRPAMLEVGARHWQTLTALLGRTFKQP